MSHFDDTKSLKAWVSDYLELRMIQFLDSGQQMDLFVEAANEVYGWGNLSCHHQRYEFNQTTVSLELTADPQLIDEKTLLSVSDWSIIRPLGMYYIELETAKIQEASKSYNLEQAGRSSSEIENDINVYRESLSAKMFSIGPLTI